MEKQLWPSFQGVVALSDFEAANTNGGGFFDKVLIGGASFAASTFSSGLRLFFHMGRSEVRVYRAQQ